MLLSRQMETLGMFDVQLKMPGFTGKRCFLFMQWMKTKYTASVHAYSYLLPILSLPAYDKIDTCRTLMTAWWAMKERGIMAFFSLWIRMTEFMIHVYDQWAVHICTLTRHRTCITLSWRPDEQLKRGEWRLSSLYRYEWQKDMWYLYTIMNQYAVCTYTLTKVQDMYNTHEGLMSIWREEYDGSSPYR